ncbi:MAG: aminopeptidase [Flavobacterium sp.]|nr:aminopeptidase [Flavobacterium sp.]
MRVTVDDVSNTLNIEQELIYFNQTSDTLHHIILNDWNHSYSDKNSPLGKRFSDEFVRNFHLANDTERGLTTVRSILDANKNELPYKRLDNQLDLIELTFNQSLLPNEKRKILLSYSIKIPNSKFTSYGYDNEGNFILRNWFITPSRYENGAFVTYSNVNIDDSANANSDYELTLQVPANLYPTCDLNLTDVQVATYHFEGKNRNDIALYLEKKNTFNTFVNSHFSFLSNINSTKIDEVRKAMIIDKIVKYVAKNIGEYPHEKIIVSQVDYDRNPFYGLNQLPSFLSPFNDDFLYELKILKTYLNNFLKSSMQLDPRKDNWIYDAIQVYTMIQYINEYYPDEKMMGKIASFKLLKGYNLVSMDFNEQYYYFYMMMARKNLDQPLGFPKDKLLKFNEKIAAKCRAGLSLKYLDSYLNQGIVDKSISDFYRLNLTQQTNRNDFKALIQSQSKESVDWFFDQIIDSRLSIDYRFGKVTKSTDFVHFSLTNKSNNDVPVSVFGIKDDQIVSKIWINHSTNDSIYKIDRNGADRLVINYQNEVPEINQRNNWKSLNRFHLLNKPIKFNFMKDIEDPHYNQIMYVPTLEYNYYDGMIPGLRLHNKTLMDKPFMFNINPTFSTKTSTISGSTSFTFNQYNRNSNLYLTKYNAAYSYFHYAPDAYYKKFNPSVSFRFRQDDFRENNKKALLLRFNLVDREKSAYVDLASENYGVFDIKYTSVKSELTNQLSHSFDLQLAEKFGKFEAEIEYRKLFNSNRSINIRFYTGFFLANNTNSNFFSFGLDRPTDYMFDYNFLGRSESTGLMSQQFIMAEGGFKSKLETRYSNQFISTVNAGFNVWNWVEIYGDAGVIKNKFEKAKFLYDSGVRLNLVTNYFELYFPVYSSNGFELEQPKYSEKIRFVFTFSPQTLINLFTRKWF